MLMRPYPSRREQSPRLLAAIVGGAFFPAAAGMSISET
jgi:hypothetical protein